MKTLQSSYRYFFYKSMRVFCLRYVFKNLWENLQKSMSEIYYMSPKIRETEKFPHGFLEISDSDYIIVSRIYGDIWRLNVSKNPWEKYIICLQKSVGQKCILMDFWRYYVLILLLSHGFLEIFDKYISPKIRERFYWPRISWISRIFRDIPQWTW